MNKKRKKQLILLCIFFLLLLLAFVALKLYQKNKPEEAKEDESYQVMQIDASQVTKITIATNIETIDLIKEDGSWRCLQDENTEIDSARIDTFLGQAGSVTSNIRIESVEDMSEYGLESPGLQITLQWGDNLDTIKVGDYNSVINCYYINKNDDPIVYTADSSFYDALNKSLDDFKAEETE